MKRLITLGIIFSNALLLLAQPSLLGNLDTSERIEYLVKIAKDVTLSFGPEFYRDSIAPIISDVKVFDGRNSELPEVLANNGRHYYSVKFPTKDALEYDYTSEVDIWEDDGRPKSIMFGTGIGLHFLGKSYQERLEQGIKIENQFRYYTIEPQKNPFEQ